MKIRDLKKFLDNLTEEQLDGELIAIGTYWDGVVHQIKPSETNLYWNGDDDPSKLMTEDEMKVQIEQEGEDKMPDVYIKKGQMILYC